MSVSAFMPLLFSFLIVVINSHAQVELTDANFESSLLSYEPKKSSVISEKKFNYGSMIIREMQEAVRNDAEGFNRADYFNVLSAFLTLEESMDNIQLAFEKFAKSEGSCEYFVAFEEQVMESDKYLVVRKKFLAYAEKCKNNQEPSAVSNSKIEEPDMEHLDKTLVALIEEINFHDQEYRKAGTKGTMEMQRLNDKENQALIDSLFISHGKYIGKSMVGAELESVMWAVIQHSNPEMMERYLPVLKEAFAEGELALAPLKMTIDRYYAITKGYQVFGSQSGFDADFATELQRKQIKEEFGIR